MGKVEEISKSEAVKFDYRKPPWPDNSKGPRENFEKILDSVNGDGSLVETAVPGIYCIKKMVFEPGNRCHINGQEISGKEINISLPISAAIGYIKESGFAYQEAQKAYQNP